MLGLLVVAASLQILVSKKQLAVVAVFKNHILLDPVPDFSRVRAMLNTSQ
jgi:hypothetical protein